MAHAEAFNALMGALDYPMFIVTTRVGDTRAGCRPVAARHDSTGDSLDFQRVRGIEPGHEA